MLIIVTAKSERDLDVYPVALTGFTVITILRVKNGWLLTGCPLGGCKFGKLTSWAILVSVKSYSRRL